MASAAQHRVRRIAQYALEPVPVEVVLDAFGGSGTTLIAAEKAVRAARLIELDPKYVDVIVRRWQDWTGELATRESDGAAYDELSVTGETSGKGFTLMRA